MGASSSWFYCGKCGFANHPRPQAQPIYVQGADGRYDLVDGNEKCEQCGEHRKHPATVDYTPRGA
jgi:ribosomal protein S27AE